LHEFSPDWPSSLARPIYDNHKLRQALAEAGRVDISAVVRASLAYLGRRQRLARTNRS
jgi:hypothetical protein